MNSTSLGVKLAKDTYLHVMLDSHNARSSKKRLSRVKTDIFIKQKSIRNDLTAFKYEG